MVRFKDEFWLFVSKSGGYWRSKDLEHWEFIEPTGLPLESYAPTVAVIQGKMYYTGGGCKAIYTTDDPAKGEWTKVADFKRYDDPDIFVDDDGKVFMFHGCSSKEPIRGVELDPLNQFVEIGEEVVLLRTEELTHGWETKNLLGSDEEIKKSTRRPYLEGAWVNKRNGVYYLQYSAPGTEMPEYADGVYVSERPLGPYRYALYSPFSFKPGGFINGAGHGSTFEDQKGNYWHSASMVIGVKAAFERRLGLFPTGFVPTKGDVDQLVCNTYLGDYPQYLPGEKANPVLDNSPGWMLVSFKKNTTASSSIDGHEPALAFDENVRTWWSAATGDPGEWLRVDLGKPCRIEAIQFNFADHDSTTLDRLRNDAYQYLLEVSDDQVTWKECVSRRDNRRDAPHEYVQLDQPVTARYARLTNIHTPGGAKFSVSGLRLFGSGLGKPPAKASGLQAQRLSNRRLAKLTWHPIDGADFYIIRYGITPDRLTHNIQVYDRQNLDLNGLNTETEYFATVDAVNDSGITPGTEVVPIATSNSDVGAKEMSQ